MLRGHVKKGIIELITILALNLIFGSQAVFAVDSITVDIDPSSVQLSLTPGVFASESQTLTVTTTNLAGYVVNLAPTGSTNALVHQSDPTFTIPTFTLPSGSSSLPAGSTGYGYGYSTDSGINYLPVPEPGSFQKIFEASSAGTDEYDLTFGALVPLEQPSGTYTGSVTIQAVAKLDPCPAYNICYYGNDDDGSGTMSNQVLQSTDTEAILIAPNFSRPGYGFAGWNTAIDGSGTNYGPNETITLGDLSTEGLQLYARWIQSSGDLQSWKGCGNMSRGAVVALTDTRDGNTYAVTKHNDDQCWMMENLRLDLSNSNLEISGLDTNRPSSSFAQAINNNHPASVNNFCSSKSSPCIDTVYHNTNNTNRNLTPSYDANNTSSSWYSYGNYYNWYTATAGYGTLDLDAPGASVNGDICPANWRLPAGYGSVGDLAILDVEMGGNGINYEEGSTGGIASSKRWRKYPMNFVLSGEQRGNTANNRAVSSSYATLNASSDERTSNLWIRKTAVGMNSNNTPKYRGQTVRCLFSEGYHINGNIHYDANGGTGTMADRINVDFGTALADENAFTKDYSAFVSWNSQADGKGVTVTAGGMVAGAADRLGLTDGDTLTLYAIWRPDYTVVYDGNGADAGSMAVATTPSVTTGQYRLIASNYSRADYGFAGWSFDSDASTKLANNQPVTVYGPNETITINASIVEYADSRNYLTLYAVWIPKDTTKTLQTFSTQDCSALNAGTVIALEDARDNDTYAVSKLADGNCWTLENLRLDPASTILDDSNTNQPTSAFSTEAQDSVTEDELCNQDEDPECIDAIHFNSNTLNRGYTPSYNNNEVESSWYSYGMMYNWYTASAGNGNYQMSSGNVAGDICPKGWRLATGGTNGEYVALNNAVNSGSTQTDLGLRKYPNNFIYSGDYNHDSPGGRNNYGRWWSATPNGKKNAFRLGIVSTGATPLGSWNKWDAFAVRCIVK